MLRLVFLALSIGGLLGLGVIDVVSANVRCGVAVLLIAAANTLLFTQG